VIKHPHSSKARARGMTIVEILVTLLDRPAGRCRPSRIQLAQ
jgi:hypothetical protein